MANPWPSDPSPGARPNPVDELLREENEERDRLTLPELPEHGTHSTALNRSAEVVGRSVGTAVAGVRSLPGKVRSRLHLVGGRELRNTAMHATEQWHEAAEEWRDAALETVEDWREAAEQKASEMAETADRYTLRARYRLRQRLLDWRYRAQRVQRRAWHRYRQAREWQPEEPLQVIAMCAGAAFLLGVTLRVWRSNSD